MARPRTIDIDDDGRCRKCGELAQRNGIRNGVQQWRHSDCTEKPTSNASDTEYRKRATRDDVARIYTAILFDTDRPADVRMRAGNNLMAHNLLEPEEDKEEGYRSPFFERVENSDVADDTDTA